MRLPIKPYYRSKHVEFYHGDCTQVLKNVKDRSVVNASRKVQRGVVSWC